MLLISLKCTNATDVMWCFIGAIWLLDEYVWVWVYVWPREIRVSGKFFKAGALQIETA